MRFKACLAVAAVLLTALAINLIGPPDEAYAHRCGSQNFTSHYTQSFTSPYYGVAPFQAQRLRIVVAPAYTERYVQQIQTPTAEPVQAPQKQYILKEVERPCDHAQAFTAPTT